MKARGFWEGFPIHPFIEGVTIDDIRISPEAKLIAYSKRIEKSRFIFIYDLNNDVHSQLTYLNSLSTGTPYGGKTFDFSKDGNSIVFSSKGKLFHIPTEGGKESPIRCYEKSYCPVLSKNYLLFLDEDKDKISLALSKVKHNDFLWPQRLPFDANFIYDPCIDENEKNIAIHHWNFPYMSWDRSAISILHLENDNEIERTTIIDEPDVATSQPQFSPDGKYISFLCDKNGWLNLWESDLEGTDPHPLIEEPLEHAYSTWITGEVNYLWLDNSKIVFTRNNKGNFMLAVLDRNKGITELDLPQGHYSKLQKLDSRTFCFLFENYNTRPQLQLIRLTNDNMVEHHRIIATSGVKVESITKDFVEPEIIEFPTKDGETATGHLYKKGKDPAPLLVLVHGGPTGMFTNRFYLQSQYFAAKGWAVFNINHRGSIGHGREYRQKLNKNWGTYDVDDVIDAIKHFQSKKIIQKGKIAIAGGSAGGYTTLMALARYPGIFKAGINLYGVSELFLLAEDTHYLESHYMDILVGILPEDSKRYIERSPLYLAENIKDPLLILQGEEDQVVPKNQSELIKEKVKGIVQLKIYPGEGHGFAKKKTLYDMYEQMEKFLKNYVLYEKPE